PQNPAQFCNTIEGEADIAEDFWSAGLSRYDGRRLGRASNDTTRLHLFLVGTAATWSMVARAQQAGKVWRIGCLSPGASGQSDNLRTFVQGLNDLGYVDGKN